MREKQGNSFQGSLTYSRSILFSVSVHGVLFFSFVFTFPVKTVAQKPAFVFLGSILDKQEVIHVPYSREQMPEQEIVSTEQLRVSSSESQFYPIQTTSVPKPGFSGDIKAKPRKFLKSKTSTDDVKPEEHQTSLKDLGINLTVPPAPKLHLYAP